MINYFKKIQWTEHVKLKMRQYGLSKIKLLNLINRPDRKEKGIADGTIAVMKTNPVRNRPSQRPFGHASAGVVSNGANKLYSSSKTKRAPGEVWLMYKDVKGFRTVISAWRYPGISKPGEAIPIPEDIREELKNLSE